MLRNILFLIGLVTMTAGIFIPNDKWYIWVPVMLLAAALLFAGWPTKRK